MKGNRVYLRKDVIKKRRKRALLRAFWLGVLLLVIIGSGIFALHQAPLKISSYSIKGVVEGNEKAIRQIVDEYVYGSGHYFIPLDTIATFPTSQIQDILEADHLVSDVNVRRKMSYPFEILIDVKEKKISNAVCIENTSISGVVACDWYGLDEEGYAIKVIPSPIFERADQSVLKTTMASTTATTTAIKAEKVEKDAVVPPTGTSTAYLRVGGFVLGGAPDQILGQKIIHTDVIQTIFLYSSMLEKQGYIATRYQVAESKTYIYIKDNGYVIIPVGLSTKPNFEIKKNEIEEKVLYLESVLTDPNLSKSLYASSTTTTINKNAKASTTKPAAKLQFEYIDARLAKKIFIDPKGKDSATATKATSTASTTKPN